MKYLALLLFVFLIQISWGQVGIKTTDPKAQLDINASNQLTPANTDGILIPRIDAFPVINPTADQNGMLVFLTTDNKFYSWNWKSPTSTGSWVSVINSEDTDNVKTKVINHVDFISGSIIWSHPEGIDVILFTGSEGVQVENNTGDDPGVYWSIVIKGDATSEITRQGVTHLIGGVQNGGFLLHDLDFEEDGNSGVNNHHGWFDITAANQIAQNDGFIMHIVYHDNDIHGTVQYWDNPPPP